MLLINNRFVLYQVKREIKRNPTTMKFYRNKVNEFNEPIKNEYVYINELVGLYHEHAPHMLDTYRILSGHTSATTRTEKMPQLMVPYEDFYFRDGGINVGDFVYHNGRLLKVTGTLNVQEWNLLMDISFEEVDEGGNTGNPFE